jgi:tubulin beta
LSFSTAPGITVLLTTLEGNNYAKGYYTEGAELLEEALDGIRREVEMCESIQGFQMIHAVGGGTGGGFGALLMDNVRQDYPDRTICSWSVMPSSKVSDVVVEPYNAVLSTHKLLEVTDFSFCIDNESLYDINKRTLKIASPLLCDLNHLLARAMCGITAAFRFPGQLNADLRKLACSLVPFPRLHFFIPGIVPITARGAQHYRGLNIPDLVNEMLSIRSMFTTCDPRGGKYLTCAAIFRGQVSTHMVEEYMFNVQHKQSRYFCEWLPNSIKTAFCDIPPRGLKTSAAFIGNNTSIACMWRRLLKDYQTIIRRKAFMHWYIQEGLQEEEFTMANANIEDMISEYQLHEQDIDISQYIYHGHDDKGDEEEQPLEEEEGADN